MPNIFNFILSAAIVLAPFCFAQEKEDAWKVVHKNIRKVREVSPGVVVGGNPVSKADGESGLYGILGLGIVQVVNLQGGDIDLSLEGVWTYFVQPGDHAEAIAKEGRFFTERGVKFFNAPLSSHKPKTNEEHAAIIKVLQLMSVASVESPIYVHCEHGTDRTGLLVALHRYFNLGWTAKAAHEQWLKEGHDAIHRFFTGDLDEYYFRVTGYQPARQIDSTGADFEAEF